MWYWFSSIIETSDHARKTRPLSVCFNVKCIYGLATPGGVIECIHFNLIYIYECVYMCSLYLCILLCNRVPWKNSVTECFNPHPHPPPVLKFSNPFAPPVTSNPGSALGTCGNELSLVRITLDTSPGNELSWVRVVLGTRCPDGLVHDCSIPIANERQILQTCTKPSKLPVRILIQEIARQLKRSLNSLSIQKQSYLKQFCIYWPIMFL